MAHFSLRGMTIQTTLSSPIPPPFPIFGEIAGVEGIKRLISRLVRSGSALNATDLWSVSRVNSRSIISPLSWTGWKDSVDIIVQGQERKRNKLSE